MQRAKSPASYADKDQNEGGYPHFTDSIKNNRPNVLFDQNLWPILCYVAGPGQQPVKPGAFIDMKYKIVIEGKKFFLSLKGKVSHGKFYRMVRWIIRIII